MSASFVVYVDESGDEGFSFGRGSSDWFVLSAVINRKAKDLHTVKLADTAWQNDKRLDWLEDYTEPSAGSGTQDPTH